MRKVPAGLAGLALATALASTVALSASAAPPDGSKAANAPRTTSDELPNPAEEKRRELRQAAIQDVIAGRAKVEQRGASKVVKVGKQAAPQRKGKAAATEDQYVELAREKTDKIFVILAEFGNERAPTLPRPGHQPGDPGAEPRSTARSTTRSRSPTARRTTRRSGRPTTRPPTSGSSTSARATTSSRSRPTTRSSRRVATASTARSATGSRCRYNEARYGRSDGFPCATNVCSNTWALIKDAIDVWVAQQKAAGRTDAQIKADSRVLRPVGPQRLRRRRQLQRARRLHRPLPDRPRRRRPGRRRPVPGRGRHLVAPLEGVPGHGPGPDRQQGRRHPDRHHRPVGRGLHDPARERRPVRVRARVRPRPRPARPLRHRGRPGQRRQLVDADGPEPRLRGRR